MTEIEIRKDKLDFSKYSENRYDTFDGFGFDKNTIDDIVKARKVTRAKWQEHGFSLCEDNGKIVRCSEMIEGVKKLGDEKIGRRKFEHFIEHSMVKPEDKIGTFHTHPTHSEYVELSTQDMFNLINTKEKISCVSNADPKVSGIDFPICCLININPEESSKFMKKYKEGDFITEDEIAHLFDEVYVHFNKEDIGKY